MTSQLLHMNFNMFHVFFNSKKLLRELYMCTFFQTYFLLCENFVYLKSGDDDGDDDDDGCAVMLWIAMMFMEADVATTMMVRGGLFA